MSKHFLTAAQVRLLRALASAECMTMRQLIAAMYDNRHDGGPLDPSNVIKVQLCHIRKALEPHGVTITAFDYGRELHGSKYGMTAQDRATVNALLDRRTAAILEHAAAQRILETFPGAEFGEPAP
jgi:hypothetical protein